MEIIGKTIKGATKLYYSWVVIILFNMCLYKSVFSTYSFWKLVFCLSAVFVFPAYSEFDLILINFYNICTIIIYIVGVRYSVFMFSLITFQLKNLWEQIHAIKTWLQLLKVHKCRFENLPVCSYSYKNTTKKISHS